MLACMLTQLCLTLCDPMDCSPPGSSVHGISPARILEWVAVSSSRGSSNPGIEPESPALAGRFFTAEPPGKLGGDAYFLVLSFVGRFSGRCRRSAVACCVGEGGGGKWLFPEPGDRAAGWVCAVSTRHIGPCLLHLPGRQRS